MPMKICACHVEPAEGEATASVSEFILLWDGDLERNRLQFHELKSSTEQEERVNFE